MNLLSLLGGQAIGEPENADQAIRFSLGIDVCREVPRPIGLNCRSGLISRAAFRGTYLTRGR